MKTITSLMYKYFPALLIMDKMRACVYYEIKVCFRICNFFSTFYLFAFLSSESIPLSSSKRGHVTKKHVLTGCKHDKLGNQTFEETNSPYDTFHVFHLLVE